MGRRPFIILAKRRIYVLTSTRAKSKQLKKAQAKAKMMNKKKSRYTALKVPKLDVSEEHETRYLSIAAFDGDKASE